MATSPTVVGMPSVTMQPDRDRRSLPVRPPRGQDRDLRLDDGAGEAAHPIELGDRRGHSRHAAVDEWLTRLSGRSGASSAPRQRLVAYDLERREAMQQGRA